MINNDPLDLSIVIPCYNETSKIGRDVEAALRFLREQNLRGEVIIVDDGSNDETAKEAEKTDSRVLHCDQHRGKGFAVKKGILAANGTIILFADSGLCTPFTFAKVGMELIKSGRCDIAHGSRKLPASKIIKPPSWSRRCMSYWIRWIFILWLDIPRGLTDTQCGFKLYAKAIARDLYQQCQTDGFLFDIEIILRAMKKGYRIEEFPISWTADRDSRLSTRKNSFEILAELIKLKKLVGNRQG